MTARLADVGSLDRSACRASVAGRFSVQQCIDRHVALFRRVLSLHRPDLAAWGALRRAPRSPRLGSPTKDEAIHRTSSPFAGGIEHH